MKTSEAGVPALDRLIHEPARLAILSALSQVEEVDFNYLRMALGLSRGNLSSHMTKLSEAGYVTINKQFLGSTPHTTYRITPKGSEALSGYWAQLEALRAPLQGTVRGVREAPAAG
ncbi:MAG: transcriptional regulator [Armatimonadetes bacterium]|nr:transcriptional regulator [Armatimonadota bacterium]